VRGGKPAGWRPAAFNADAGLAGGSNVWFGVFCDWFAPRFDYGAKCYWDFWDHLGDSIPNTYPVWSACWFYDFRLSMYFTYSAAQNYVRTLTQGVKLSDSRKQISGFKRAAADTARAISRLGKLQGFYRKRSESVRCNLDVSRQPAFIRKCSAAVNSYAKVERHRIFFRSLTERIKAISDKREAMSAFRKCFDEAGAAAALQRAVRIFRNAQDSFKAFDNQSISALYLRSAKESMTATDNSRRIMSIFCRLFSLAGNADEIKHEAEYCRNAADSVDAQGKAFRGFLIFARIAAVLFARDYLLSRFIKARAAIELKSNICREIIFDSRIG